MRICMLPQHTDLSLSLPPASDCFVETRTLGVAQQLSDCLIPHMQQLQ